MGEIHGFSGDDLKLFVSSVYYADHILVHILFKWVGQIKQLLQSGAIPV